MPSRPPLCHQTEVQLTRSPKSDDSQEATWKTLYQIFHSSSGVWRSGVSDTESTGAVSGNWGMELPWQSRRPSLLVSRGGTNTVLRAYMGLNPYVCWSYSPPFSRGMFLWMATGTLALLCIVVVYVGRRALGRRTAYPLPPGPPGLPWVGTIIGVNTNAPWLTYAEWARTYGSLQHVWPLFSTEVDMRAGDLVYSRLLGKDIIIINSEKIAKDLLENRSKNYSDRPYLITNELWGLCSFRTSDLSPLFKLWSGIQFRFYVIRRSMAITQTLFSSDVPTRDGTEISALSTP